MVKILAQAGMSLADVYNVQGSIVGIDQLEAREVTLVHEMGATILSERVSGFIRRIESTVSQSSNIGVILTDLPAGPYKIAGVTVLATSAARVVNVMVALRDGEAGREMPFFVWDTAVDGSKVIRIEPAGAGAINTVALTPSGPPFGSVVAVGTGQPQRVNQIALRGVSTAFGAGTVTVTALVYVIFSHVGGLNSRGLPFPGW